MAGRGFSSGSKDSGISVYVGAAAADLQPLLSADIGILVDPEPEVLQLLPAFGVEVRLLLTGAHAVSGGSLMCRSVVARECCFRGSAKRGAEPQSMVVCANPGRDLRAGCRMPALRATCHACHLELIIEHIETNHFVQHISSHTTTPA